MAQPITCDICGLEQAVQMLTNLQDGNTLAIGALCSPTFYGHSHLAVTGAGEHRGPASKCQACRRLHEQMTTPVAPLEVAAGDAPGDLEVIPANTAEPTAP